MASESGGADSRRTIDDLESLHSVLERHLRDVYVEGRRDARLVRWYVRESGLIASGIYAADDRLSVPSDAVLACGGEVGARGRLLALATASAAWDTEPFALTIIVDADRDILFPGTDFPALFRTDFCSMDVYAFQPRPLGQLLSLVLDRDLPGQDVIDILAPPLHELFLVRTTLHVFGPGILLVSTFTTSMEFTDSSASVDCADLLRRSLASADGADQFGRLSSKLGELRRDAAGLPHPLIRGHDIAPVLIQYLHLKNDFTKPQVIEQAMRGVLRPDDLDNAPLFRALRDRLS